MAPRAHVSLPYRAGLDGLRGIAVAGVVIYHLAPQTLPGGWFGVDLFFVLSGFLICSLLLSEQDRWGRIDLTGFWLARARRLLPALVTVLIAVVVATALWAPAGRRGPIGWDTIAALGYFANWRFLASDEAYFGQIALPSPLRHTWSLSIEEQFYWAFPLLLSLLAMIVRTRKGKALCLGALAVLSAGWMAWLYVPGTDPSRVYYGTDTRAFELLIGAAAACLFSRTEFAGRATTPQSRWLQPAAWTGLGLVLVAFVTLDEQSAVPFRGGLFLLAVVSLAPILAAAHPAKGSVQRLLTWEPLRRLGLISYSLYLWHWPVIVFLSPEVTGLQGLVLTAARALTSLALAAATYRFIEQPIRRQGFGALFRRRVQPSRLATGLSIPLVIFGALALPYTSPQTSPAGAAAQTESAELPQPAYTPLNRDWRAVLLGNSVPASLVSGFDSASYPDLTMSGVVNFGCDPFDGRKVLDGGKLQPETAECVTWKKAWPGEIRKLRPDVVTFMVPQTLVSDFNVAGRQLTFGTPAHDQFIADSLTQVRSTALAAGSRSFAVMTLACHDVPDFGLSEEQSRVNDVDRVRRVNKVVTSWASRYDVAVIDTFGALCSSGFKPNVNGVPLYKDGLHFTESSAPVMWRWLVPQLQAEVREKASP